MAKSKSVLERFCRKVHFQGVLGPCRGLIDSFPFKRRCQNTFEIDSEKKMAMFHQKMAIWPLEHPKNALFSKIAPKQIYFWPYSIKGSWLEYQKPHIEGGHWPLAWHQKWRAVSSSCSWLPHKHFSIDMAKILLTYQQSHSRTGIQLLLIFF